MSRNIYVGNLPFSVEAAELEHIFGDYGTVESAAVIYDRHTDRSRGFGFVKFASDAEGERALEGLQGHLVGGRALQLAPAFNRMKPRGSEGRGAAGSSVRTYHRDSQ